MKLFKKYIIIGIFALIANHGFGQTDTIFKTKGKPIIQVFGNFDYNATQDALKNMGFGLVVLILDMNINSTSNFQVK